METFLSIFEKITPIITILISSLISYLIAKINAKNEIRKSLLIIKKEQESNECEAFATLIPLLEQYASHNSGRNHSYVLKSFARFMALAPDCCKVTLLELLDAINSYNPTKIRKLSRELTIIYSNHIIQNSKKQPTGK